MYRERVSQVPGAVLWQAVSPADTTHQRVLPDGCLDLLWSAGALLVAGPDTTAHGATWSPGDRHVGLRFAPGTGPVILGVPARELRDRRVPLADLWPDARVRALSGQLADARLPGRVLEHVALERLRRARPAEAALVEVAARLGRGATVAATAAAVGLSERQLYRRSLVAFGYGPKALARILRMNRAVEMARAGVPFATVAAESGYADQAHLAREVRALTGVPLGSLIR